MKGSCTLLASALAASTMAISSSGNRDVAVDASPNEQCSSSSTRSSPACSSEKEKFTPRFDGLRFIETLVTAHR